MRVLVTMLTLALLAASAPATPAQAQCAMSCPQGADAKANPKKVAAAKKVKKEKVEYMKAAN